MLCITLRWTINCPGSLSIRFSSQSAKNVKAMRKLEGMECAQTLETGSLVIVWKIASSSMTEHRTTCAVGTATELLL